MSDRIRHWDERFARGEELHGYAPSPPLPAAVAGIEPGLALDLACGAGRHAIWRQARMARACRRRVARPLFEQIRKAVRPGGRFAGAIRVRTAPDETGRFLLEPGELRALVESWGWEILHSHEGPAAESDHHHGTAELIARRPES